MGERANFGFRQENGDTIFLYGHWAGGNHFEQLALALHSARPRWDDESYATRICISQIIGNEWAQETGWGIYTELMHNEYPVPIVDWKQGLVFIHNSHVFEGMEKEPYLQVTFDDFINANIRYKLARA